MIRLAVVLLALGLGGCMISEQAGELDKEPLVYTFDSDFNRLIVGGRTVLLVGLAVWIFLGETGGSRVLSYAVGVPALAVAGALLLIDLPRLTKFRVEVEPGALHLNVPPAPAREVAWSDIEGLRVEGLEWQRGGRDASGKKLLFTTLPEWKTMTLTLAGGETYEMNLEVLSVEHRGILFRAISGRAGLVEQ
jgi:hypothetical protein